MRIPMLIVLGLAALALAACGTTAPTVRSGVHGDSEAEPRSSTPAAVQDEVGDASPPPPEAAPPEAPPPKIDDPPSDAELVDLQSIATRGGISLQDAIDRYGWRDNFSLAVAKIREASPATFAGGEIVDAGHAWVSFTGPAPAAAFDIIDIFTSSHSSISVEVRTDRGFSEVELQTAIPAVHYAVLGAPEVRDASTTFDTATSQIRTVVVLESTASDSILDDLRAVAEKNLIDATRPDIVNSITISVVR